MFKVKSSPTRAIPQDRLHATASPAPIAGIGTDAKSLRIKNAVLEENLPQGVVSQSNISMAVPGSPNTTVSGNPITIDVDPMLTGLTTQTEHMLYRVYKDIYYNDAIGGSGVDLMSVLPFSDFNLGGMTMQGSSKPRDVFMESLNRLNIRSLLPQLSIDYLVLGAHISSLLYNRDKRMFTDIMPHQPENVKVEPLYLFSQDPLLTVTFPQEVKAMLGRTGSKRIDAIKAQLGSSVVDSILSGTLELEPLNTLFIPRRTFSRTDKGTSYFRRILPIYLIEKNLFRGTIVESARRQRGILHASLGDGEEWIPTPQDMEFITELLMNADSDPIGAIIATRSGISIDEIRQGGDFWKVTDFADSVLSMKLRALSLSESFLSGEASYNTSDNGMMVFLEMLRSYREYITHVLFYNKLFPLISLINGFTMKNDRIKIDTGLINRLDKEDALFQLNDGSKLLIPTVQWTKHLKPEGDSAYMEMLNTLTEKGVPVTLRALAAAGGIDIEQCLREQSEDIDLRKRVKEYLDKVAALNPPAEGEGESESTSSARSAVKLISLSSPSSPVKVKSSVLAERGRSVPLLSRDFSRVEPYRLSKTGVRKPVLSAQRARFDRKANEQIVASLRDIRKRGLDKKMR